MCLRDISLVPRHQEDQIYVELSWGSCIMQCAQSPEDKIMNDPTKDNRFSFVEADQFFYFDKSKIRYIHIGKIEPDIYNLIIEFIQEINANGVAIKQIVDKATKIEPNDN